MNRTYQRPGYGRLPVLKWLPREPVYRCLQDFYTPFT